VACLIPHFKKGKIKMITELIIDTEHANAGTPVRFVGEAGRSTAQGRIELVRVELPSGEQVVIDAGAVSSGVHHPEETLSVLSSRTGIREDTLLKAAQSGRLMARRSGATWLSTIPAVGWAKMKGKIK
jgi:hypothetical protein